MKTVLTVRCAITVLMAAVAAFAAEKKAPATSTLEPKPPKPPVTTGKIYKPKDKLPDFVLKHNLNKDGSPNGENFVEEKEWFVSEFIGSGDVWLEDDTVFIGEGNDMTGIMWKGPLPSMNYEVTLDAKRVAGEDFFCGLTFLYGKDPCSLIVGGWGGRLVGISSLDWMDASENGTATWREFKNDTWYSIKLRVTPKKIEAWIDGEQLVNVDTEGKEIGIRFEVEPSRPFGIATWRTAGALRNIRIRAFNEGQP